MSLQSMTGFGRAAVEVDGGLLGCELRSVNHRFCDIKVRSPREFAHFEPAILAQLREALVRGAIEVSLRWQRRPANGVQIRVDEALLAAYKEAIAKVADELGVTFKADPQRALEFEGLLHKEEPELDEEHLGQAVRQCLEAAITGLREGRAREGAAMEADLRARAKTLARLLEQIQTVTDSAAASRQTRLKQRLALLISESDLDPGRLAMEVAILADKADVSEEITRFAAHLEAVEVLLKTEGAVGRRFDFLVQELNREANTIGSKSAEVSQTQVVMEMKAEIEKIREQVQNVE